MARTLALVVAGAAFHQAQFGAMALFVKFGGNMAWRFTRMATNKTFSTEHLAPSKFDIKVT